MSGCVLANGEVVPFLELGAMNDMNLSSYTTSRADDGLISTWNVSDT